MVIGCILVLTYIYSLGLFIHLFIRLLSIHLFIRLLSIHCV